jgi:hypothetical protein
MVNDNQSNSDQDVVFSRLLDGRGRAADWQRLREATAGDGGNAAWDRIIGNAGDQDVLGEVVGLAGDRAGETDLHRAMNETLPVTLAVPSAQGRRTDRAVRAARLGWLVAACMALGLVSVSLRPSGGGGGATQGANLAPFSLENLSSSDLMNGYKARAAKEGTLVGELPQRVVIETRPSADGKGYEVLYMRQFIERAIVDDLYKLGTDETGRPVMVPTSMTKTKPAGAM